MMRNNNVDVNNSAFENEIPKEFLNGDIKLGYINEAGKDIPIFLKPNDTHTLNPLVLVGLQASGKDSLIENLIIDMQKSNQCNIVLDFCNSCYLSKNIEKQMNKEDLIIINCSVTECEESFALFDKFEEANDFIGEKHVLSKEELLFAREFACQTIEILESITGEELGLTNRMKRVIDIAAQIIYLSNGNFNDLLRFMVENSFREEKIQFVNNMINENTNQEVNLSLLELIGELNLSMKYFDKLGLAVEERFYLLKRNMCIDKMLKNTQSKTNLLDCIMKKKTILIRIPMADFLDRKQKDTISTYWFFKVINDIQMLKTKYSNNESCCSDLPIVNVFINECFQTPYLLKCLGDSVGRLKTLKVRPILTCHHLNQFSPNLREILKLNLSNYIFMGRQIILSLNDFFEEDLSLISQVQDLQRFHSFNYIHDEKGVSKFVLKLPIPIEV